MLIIQNVKKIYSDNKTDDVIALDNVSLEFPEKGMVFITGKSGCGKTTLLNVIAGLDGYNQGDIFINDMQINRLSDKLSDKYRNEYLGVIFQDYSLLEQYSVKENILLPLRIREYDDSFNAEDKLEYVLKCVDMEGYGLRKPSELSGGQKQRVAIARAIIKSPRILLADEPTGNLDKKNSDIVMTILKKLSKEILVIIVSHDAEETVKYADRVIEMSDGKIILDKENNASYDYSYNLKSAASNISICNVEREELIKEIDSVVCECTGDSKEYDMTISCKKKHVADENIDNNGINSKYKIKGLNFIKILSLAMGNMRRKKMRFAITLGILSIISLLTIMVGFLLHYPKKDVVEEFINLRKYYTTSVYEDRTFYNEEEKIKSEITLYNGRSFFENIEDSLDYNDVVVCKDDISITKNEDVVGSILAAQACALYLHEDNDYYDYEGNFPNKANEVMVSDYIVYEELKMSNVIGKTILINEEPFVVSGIVNTDYSNYEYLYQIRTRSYSELIQYEEETKFLFAIFNKEYIEDIYGDWAIYIDQGNFMYREDSLYNSITINGQNNCNLLWGELPQKSNEIIIGYDIAEELGYVKWNQKTGRIETFFEEPISFEVTDLYDEEYGYDYYDSLNLYDYLGDKVTVVGIAGISDTLNANVYIKDDVYKNIKEDYFKYFYGEKYLLYYDDITKFVNQCEKNDIVIDNPIVYNIISFAALLKEAKILLYVVITLLLLVLFLVIVSYVSYSISDSSRSIGIMRTLGITNRDILKIYSQEALMLSALSIIVTFLETNIFLRFINNKYSEQILGFKTVFLAWNHNVMFVLVIIICIICILASAIPIRRLSKLYPIKLMKNMY
ncbi:MAG: ABC transporter ATP-binding protein/permease [Lachnospiraceae bacterium]|nr:ABC transporter ATP-binding protein/permease [Lachnospiraceae bacterium]